MRIAAREIYSQSKGLTLEVFSKKSLQLLGVQVSYDVLRQWCADDNWKTPDEVTDDQLDLLHYFYEKFVAARKPADVRDYAKSFVGILRSCGTDVIISFSDEVGVMRTKIRELMVDTKTSPMLIAALTVIWVKLGNLEVELPDDENTVDADAIIITNEKL